MSGVRVVAPSVLAAAFLIGCAGASRDDAPTGYWRGAFEIGEQRWDVGLHYDGQCASGATIDIPQVWRSRAPVDDLTCDGAEIGFELPLGLGAYSGVVTPREINGAVARSDGARSDLDLAPASSPSYRGEDFSFQAGDVFIGADLFSPSGPGPFPAIVVVHGGGDSTRHAEPYHFWADYLSARGFAVVVYDKRGNGESSGDWRDVGFDERARDLAAIVNQLAARDDIDSNAIGLLAVSQGGWVSVRTDALSDQIAYMIMVSVPAVSVLEADTFAFAGSLRSRGLSANDADAALALWAAEVDVIRNLGSQSQWEAYESLVAEARVSDWWAASGYEPLSPESWFGRWYAQVLDFDPRSALEASGTPSLWLYGAADTQSDPARNAEVLTALRSQGWPGDVITYPRGDHGVLVADGPDGAYPAAAQGFFEDLTAWLEAWSGRGAPPPIADNQQPRTSIPP